MSAAPLPPLAREASLVDGWLWVYAGEKAWKLVGRGDDCRAVIYPVGKRADEYTWPVLGRRVMVIGHDRAVADLELLVGCLLRAGSTEVWLQHDLLATPERYDRSDLRRRA